ncbi:MAG: hypothetical protein AAFN74_00755 [Myxococcota bacterium]
MAEVSGKKIIPILGIAGAAFMGLGYFISQDLGGPARANRARLTRDAGPSIGQLTQKERADYLENKLLVEGFTVEPETRPDTQKPVPGVLRVKGQVKNTGDLAVDKVVMFVNTKDETGIVVSTFQQNLADRGPLAPGEVRSFLFRIPARKTFTDFDYKLR